MESGVCDSPYQCFLMPANNCSAANIRHGVVHIRESERAERSERLHLMNPSTHRHFHETTQQTPKGFYGRRTYEALSREGKCSSELREPPRTVLMGQATWDERHECQRPRAGPEGTSGL